MAIVGLLVAASNANSQGTITTVVGTDWLFPNQTLAALNAPLGLVNGVVVTAGGAVFLADSSNQMVMQISGSGQIQIVAGNGLAGYSSDGPSATSRSLLYPGSLAADQAGNVYVAESGRIREIHLDDSITTVVGGGNAALSDGVPAASVYVPAARGLTIDNQGNLYFASGAQVWKVTTQGTVRLVAGNGQYKFSGDGGPATQASMSGPTGVAVDGAGNIYISDYLDDRIRKITTAGIISTIAGTGPNGRSGDGGPATSAELNQPEDVTVDSSGNIYILEYYSSIRKISAAGTISTILQNGLLFPQQFALSAAGGLVIADSADFQVKSLSSSGSLVLLAGNGGYRKSPDGTPSQLAWLDRPQGITLDAVGTLYISDHYLEYGGIRKVSGGLLSTVPATYMSPRSTTVV